MKLLVFSDSHGTTAGMCSAVEAEKPDMICHLGDVVSDGETLSRAFPEIPFIQVCGNCDVGDTHTPEVRFIEPEGVPIFLTHGHRYRVKWGLSALLNAASAARAQVVLYGHTHQAEITELYGMTVINPGPGSTGYARLIIENGAVTSELWRFKK